MKTKFIGTDGFKEIESISDNKKRDLNNNRKARLTTAQKTLRFIKRAGRELSRGAKSEMNRAADVTAAKLESAKRSRSAKAKSKPVLPERHYSGRTESSFPVESLNIKNILPRSKKYKHSAPKEYRPHHFVKKRAALSIAACLAAIVLSCVTVVSAFDAPDAKLSNSAKPAAAAASANIASPKGGLAAAPASFDEAVSIDLETAAGMPGSELYCFKVDGETIGVTSEGEKLSAALDKYLVDYRKAYDDTTVTEFRNKVTVERMSSASGVSQDEIRSAQELFDAAKDKFSVSLFTDWSYDLDIDYDVEVSYDENEDSDYEKVVREGKPGVCRVNVRLTYVDGEFTNSEVIDTENVKEPVTEKIIRGAKQGKPKEEEKKSSGGTTGSFIWPVTHTKGITTYFEMRWGSMHHGIDIAGGGDYGQPIIASDGGMVTFSGYDDSGYGNYVIIDHGNGYETLYGHACELAVSAGQYVNQGDVIAYVGSTGFSTGPHLHFEVRVNGEREDPFNYLSE